MTQLTGKSSCIESCFSLLLAFAIIMSSLSQPIERVSMLEDPKERESSRTPIIQKQVSGNLHPIVWPPCIPDKKIWFSRLDRLLDSLPVSWPASFVSLLHISPRSRTTKRAERLAAKAWALYCGFDQSIIHHRKAVQCAFASLRLGHTGAAALVVRSLTSGALMQRNLKLAAELAELLAPYDPFVAFERVALVSALASASNNDKEVMAKEQYVESTEFQRALAIVKVLSLANDPAAQSTLGQCLRYGTGLAEDVDAAMNLFEKAFEQGHAGALVNLGGCFQGLKQSDKATQCYKVAADLGHPTAHMVLAERLTYEAINQPDYKNEHANEIESHFMAALNQGVRQAAYKLSDCLRGGLGMPADLSKAVQFFKLAHKWKEPAYMYNLALCYDGGFGGLEQHRGIATDLFVEAAHLGHADSQIVLAEYLQSGRCQRIDIERDPIYWLRKAAQQNHYGATLGLAVCYRFGTHGCDFDRAKALRLFRKCQALRRPGSFVVVPWTFLNMPRIILGDHFEKLGDGAYGTAYLNQLNNGHHVVVKEYHLQQTSVAVAYSELEMMLCVGEHPNVVQLFGYATSSPEDLYNGKLLLVLRHAEHGSLDRIFKATDQKLCQFLRSDPLYVLLLAQDIAKGLAYIHQTGVFHSDISLRNLVLTSDFQVQFIDFGLAFFDDGHSKTTELHRLCKVLYKIAFGSWDPCFIGFIDTDPKFDTALDHGDAKQPANQSDGYVMIKPPTATVSEKLWRAILCCRDPTTTSVDEVVSVLCDDNNADNLDALRASLKERWLAYSSLFE